MDERVIRTAVVTGPTGDIGHALVSLLAKRGIEVFAIVHPGSRRMSAVPNCLNVHKVELGLSELGRLEQMISKPVDAFFHLAWARTDRDGRNDLPTQVENVRFAVEAVQTAAALGCQVFVGAGSQAEYGRVEGKFTAETPCFPETGYGMAKLCAGQMTRLRAHQLGLVHVWPRILSVYGPYQGKDSMIISVIQELLRGGTPQLTGGEQVWDYMYSEDAAEALLSMAVSGCDGAVYPLGSGSAATIRSYVETMRDAIDPSLRLDFGAIPYDAHQVMHLEADIAQLTRDTGFIPKISFREGIEKTINWVRDEAKHEEKKDLSCDSLLQRGGKCTSDGGGN